MKKLLLLGGAAVLEPVIRRAQQMGIYVITCDYLPQNVAHQFSDKYEYASTMDKEAVLEVAMRNNIDGIMSFACDSGVVSAAYVAEQMGLNFQCSYESACILQDKGKFRKFLIENSFNCPNAKRYEDVRAPFEDVDYFNWPVIVKPTDSAGSRGVTRVDRVEDLEAAIERAIENGHNDSFIIEDFLEFEGYHSSTDPFTIDGKLVFTSYSDQLFDETAENPYTPSLIIWPSTMEEKYQSELTSEIQRVFDLLKMKDGIYNIETCVAGKKGYIMEISPRGGGCRIAEIQHMAFGIDFIESEIKKAVGEEVPKMIPSECKDCWCEMVVHAKPGQRGVLEKIWLDPEIEEKYVVANCISAKAGDTVEPFSGGNCALGDIIFKFPSREVLIDIMKRENEWLHIETR